MKAGFHALRENPERTRDPRVISVLSTIDRATIDASEKAEWKEHRMRRSTALASAGVMVMASLGGTVAATGDGWPRHRSCAAERDTVAKVPLRIPPAWAANDADAFAAVFTADASFIVPGQDTYLRNRQQIRDYMAALFAGPIKGTRVTAVPLDVRCVGRDVGVVVTQGGMLVGDETEVPLERVGRQTWVIVRQGHDWAVAAYQNSRITPG
jgi:uncharacterized protein (TIGR02246 family)